MKHTWINAQKCLKNGGIASILLWFFVSSCICQRQIPLRIGMNPWLGYDFLYLAKEKGFFADAGVDVEIAELMSLQDVMRAYENGQIDIMAATVVEAIHIRDETKMAPVIFHVVDYSNGSDVVISQSSIHSLADLRGKKVGIEPGTLNTYLLAKGLALKGLKISDVKLVNVNFVDMESQFLNKNVDAVVTFPPASNNILKTGNANILFSSKEIPGEIADVLAIEQSKVESRKDDLKKIIRCFYRAVEYAKEHPDGYEIIAKRENLTVAEVKGLLNIGIKLIPQQELTEYLESGGKLDKLLKKVYGVLKDTGQVSSPIDLKTTYVSLESE